MTDIIVQARLAQVVHLIEPDTYSPRGPTEIVINRGASEGVKPGDRYLVFGEGPTVTDPGTGKELGQLELVRGQGEVVHVQPHMATVRSLERRRARPIRRVVRESGSQHFGGIAPALRPIKTIEEELEPETILPFDHVRLGDQAKPI